MVNRIAYLEKSLLPGCGMSVLGEERDILHADLSEDSDVETTSVGHGVAGRTQLTRRGS